MEPSKRKQLIDKALGEAPNLSPQEEDIFARSNPVEQAMMMAGVQKRSEAPKQDLVSCVILLSKFPDDPQPAVKFSLFDKDSLPVAGQFLFITQDEDCFSGTVSRCGWVIDQRKHTTTSTFAIVLSGSSISDGVIRTCVGFTPQQKPHELAEPLARAVEKYYGPAMVQFLPDKPL